MQAVWSALVFRLSCWGRERAHPLCDLEVWPVQYVHVCTRAHTHTHVRCGCGAMVGGDW